MVKGQVVMHMALFLEKVQPCLLQTNAPIVFASGESAAVWLPNVSYPWRVVGPDTGHSRAVQATMTVVSIPFNFILVLCNKSCIMKNPILCIVKQYFWSIQVKNLISFDVNRFFCLFYKNSNLLI